MHFRILTSVYLDKEFLDFYGNEWGKHIDSPFFGKFGLQKIFNIKGLGISIHFAVIEVKALTLSALPSSENLR